MEAILEKRDQFEQEVLSLLRQEFWFREEADGTFTGEIYADYRDEMDSKTAIKICEDEHPWQMFDATLDEWYFDYEGDLKDDLCRELARKLDDSRPDGLTREEKDALWEIVNERVNYEYPANHYLKQEFYVNVMLDTGDANYDFVLNSVYPCWSGSYEERIHDKAAIVWLARSQGYTKTQLWHALRQGDMVNPKGFLESMRVELANLPSCMSIVTFLVRLRLQDLISINEALHYRDREYRKSGTKRSSYCGFMKLAKNTMTGLFNPWSGAGAPLEVELEKDVRIPFTILRSVLPDGGEGYASIAQVYDMCGSAWRNTVTQIQIPQKVRDQF